MDPRKHSEGADAPLDIEAVDHLIGDLELGPDTGDAAVIEPLDEAGVEAVEAAVAKSEAYEDQPTGTTAIEAAPVGEPETTAKTKRAKTPKAPKVKAIRELSELPNETFLLASGDVASDIHRDIVIGLRPAQKKIGEKFDNLFLSICNGKKPSVYTMACFNALVAAGTVTSMDLVAALKATLSTSGKHKGSGYNDGTARSQAGQMMALFSVVGIATRTKQTLAINNDSPLVSKLKALAV